MEWQPGYKLKSRPYQIESVLGEGGFGITYKAQNLVLEIPVVIKTPNRKLQRDKNYRRYVKNFVREAKQLAQLGLNPHPHIVRVIELFTEETLPCIVMDYIPGKSLYDLVQIQGALPETLAVEYIKQIGSALVICHESGIIHRDLHPNNILIHQENQKAVLIDFGISINIQTSRNTYSGNQVFAPWEQLVNFEVQQNKTPQVDIYTSAASLYYLVTGETPTPSLARKYSNRELIPPKQLIPKLSEAINQAIIKGMELDPSNRPNSMKEWLDLLTLPNNQDSSLPHPHSRQIPLTFATDKIEPKVPHANSVFENLTRRKILKWLSLTSIGMGVTLISQKCLISSEKNLITQTKISYTKEQFDVITVNDQGKRIKLQTMKGEYYTENLGDGITLDMASIPSGTFMMGTREEERERLLEKFKRFKFQYKRERPQHKVTVKPFLMGKYPVTEAQWKTVASLPKVERDLNHNRYKKSKNLPITNISWYDAVEFCQRLSKQTGREYRLPSEAEWEYACRAGTTTPFHFGETITADLANYNAREIYANEPEGMRRLQLTPVGSFPPNAFGLYDMHGNVYEWCEDNWHENYEGAPTDGLAWLSGNSNLKVRRGGSYFDPPWYCRSAYRNDNDPADPYNYSGFRVACGVP